MKRAGLVLAVLIGLVLFALCPLLPVEKGELTLVVEGEGMSPGICDGQLMYVDEDAEPARFDVVVFRSPEDHDRLIVSRVVGLPGERVQIDEGRLLVDGALVQEPASVLPGSYGDGPHDLADEFYLLGDNRENSRDSRTWGTILVSDVVG